MREFAPIVLRLRLLGDFAVEVEGREVRRLRARKYAHLLARIALTPNQAVCREELIELFWPEESIENGRACLRTALSSLRRQLNAPDLFMEGARDTVKLNAGRLCTDVQEFEARVSSGDGSARSLYRGPLLPGCYDDWALDERLRLEALFDSLPELPPAVQETVASGTGATFGLAVTMPSPLTRFYGRHEEISLLLRYLEEERERLVSIVGLGGSGKTRLAIEVGRVLSRRTVFVALSEVKSAFGLAAACVDAMQLDRAPLDTLDRRLRLAVSATPTVLILDNFEQLTSSESASWLVDLIEAVPALAVVVTSRIPVGAVGERTMNLSSLRHSDAVDLFLDRARRIRPDFPDSLLLAELCDRLDRMPLAIELCASWANVLSSRRMLEGLSDRFELMESRCRAVNERHRKLHTVLEWSCSAGSELREPLGVLSVMRGTWSLEAAEAMLGSSAARILDALHQRSLIYRTEESDDSVRFGILESVRHFASEGSTHEQKEFAELKRYRYYSTLANRFLSEYDENPQPTLRFLDREHSNIFAAMEFGCQGSPDMLAKTVETIQRIRYLWIVRGRRAAIDACNARLASRAEEVFEPRLRAIVLASAGEHACRTGDYVAAIDLLNRSVDLAGEAEEYSLQTLCLQKLSHAYQSVGAWDDAIRAYERVLDVRTSFEEYHFTLAHMAGMFLESLKQPDRAEPIYRQLLAAWMDHPNGRGHVAVMRRCLGTCALLKGEYQEAESLIRQSLPWFEESGQSLREGEAWLALAQSLAAQGRDSEAALASERGVRLTACAYVS